MANIVPATAGMRLTAAFLNQFIPGSFTACSLNNGWTNHGGGSSVLSVRMLNAVTGLLVGQLNVGTTTANTQFGTLPSVGFFPISAQAGTGIIVAGTNTGQEFGVIIEPSGSVQLANAALSGATSVVINSLYPLDI